jgi:hypothetical protein
VRPGDYQAELDSSAESLQEALYNALNPVRMKRGGASVRRRSPLSKNPPPKAEEILKEKVETTETEIQTVETAIPAEKQSLEVLTEKTEELLKTISPFDTEPILPVPAYIQEEKLREKFERIGETPPKEPTLVGSYSHVSGPDFGGPEFATYPSGCHQPVYNETENTAEVAAATACASATIAVSRGSSPDRNGSLDGTILSTNNAVDVTFALEAGVIPGLLPVPKLIPLCKNNSIIHKVPEPEPEPVKLLTLQQFPMAAADDADTYYAGSPSQIAERRQYGETNGLDTSRLDYNDDVVPARTSQSRERSN